MQVGRRRLTLHFANKAGLQIKTEGQPGQAEAERMKMSCPDNQYKTAQKPKTSVSPQSSYIMTEVLFYEH